MTYRHFIFFALFPFAVLIVVLWALVAGLLGCTAHVMRDPLLALANEGGGIDRVKAWVKHDQA